MKNRILAFVGAVCILSTLMIGTAFAGGWRLGSKGWWYDLDNGQYYADGWYWIDGDQDGIAERYYFDQDGCTRKEVPPTDISLMTAVHGLCMGKK